MSRGQEKDLISVMPRIVNNCPVCGNHQEIDDIGIITRKRIVCRSCKNELVIIEKPSSFFLDILFVFVLLAIYAPLRQAGYGQWIFLPISLFIILAFVLVKFRIPSGFITMTADNWKVVGRAEKMNHSLG